MALSTATVTFDIADLLGTDFDARRTKCWVTTNVPDDTLIDTTGQQIRLGSGNVTVGDDGTGSATVWVPSADANPTSWQTTFHFDYPDRNAPKGRARRSFGPYTITTDADLATLEEEQAVPATYETVVTQRLDAHAATLESDMSAQVDTAAGHATDAAASAAAAEAARDAAVDISNIDTSDDVVAALIGDPASATASGLNASFVVPLGKITPGAVAPIPWINAKDYGCVGDGETDDTAALQAAIDAVEAVGGGTVLIPPGLYAISSGLTITADGVHVVGSGENATKLYAPAALAASTSVFHIEGAAGERPGNIRIARMLISGDPRLGDPLASDLKHVPYGITVDLSSFVMLERVYVDHVSSAGIATTGNNSNGSGTGPDQLFLFWTKVSVSEGAGVSVAHGHSLHWIGGLAEFCQGYAVDLANVNSIFISEVDIEDNSLAGARVQNNFNVVFRNCTFEHNAKSLASGSVEKCHIWIGTFNTSQVITETCFFHADGMRNIVRIDKGRYCDRDSQIFDATASTAWDTGSNRGAVLVFSDDAEAQIDGDFSVIWPSGSTGAVQLLPLGRGRWRQGRQSATWGTATPAFGTWERGDVTHKTDAAASGSPGWTCTVPGTNGTLNGGATTGSITSGTKTLTVNTATGLFVGAYITIGAEGNVWRVLTISGTTIGVERALNPAAGASSTQTDVAVSFVAPTWTAQANLAP